MGVAFGHATLGAMGFAGRQEYGPVGSVANLASRLCSAADPGHMLNDQRTHAQVERSVDSEPLEPIEVKGFPSPVRGFSVSGRRSASLVNARGD